MRSGPLHTCKSSVGIVRIKRPRRAGNRLQNHQCFIEEASAFTTIVVGGHQRTSTSVTVVDGASITAYAVAVSKISPKLIAACRIAIQVAVRCAPSPVPESHVGYSPVAQRQSQFWQNFNGNLINTFPSKTFAPALRDARSPLAKGPNLTAGEPNERALYPEPQRHRSGG